ncbi:hypothetical protein PR003_g11514 [Phytophthora rubi]|uniref:Uncharacterized protein n=1 Tax=Phytophthora rubi TaxID=129364 RepID=A0A6A4FAK2_9STRA|nr:hypothetical protein PR003_g11514 [Phytophthora rubi]
MASRFSSVHKLFKKLCWNSGMSSKHFVTTLQWVIEFTPTPPESMSTGVHFH